MVMLVLIFLLLNTSARIALLGLTFSNLLLLHSWLYFNSDICMFSGLLSLSYKSYICQLVVINMCIFRIINKNYSARPLVAKLFIKSLIRLLDLSFISSFYYYFQDMYEIKMCMLTSKEKLKLNDDMHGVLTLLNKMTFKLSSLKLEANVEYLTINNVIYVVPLDQDKLSEDELTTLAKKVSLTNKIYNSKLSEYNKLVDKDIKLNNSDFSKSFEKTFNSIKTRHGKLLTEVREG